MTPLPIRHNSSSKRTVFRKKVDISNKSTIKVLLEALLMLTIGSSLLLVVNSIPNKIELTEDIMDSGTKILLVIAETADILVVIGTVLLIITIIIKEQKVHATDIAKLNIKKKLKINQQR